MTIKSLLVSLLVLMLAFPVQSAPVAKEKEADIRRLFDLIDLRATTKMQLELSSAGVAIAAIGEAEKKSKLSESQKKEIVQAVLDAHSALTEKVIDLAVETYDHSYSHSEIRELINFYLTPVGLKSVRLGTELQLSMLLTFGAIYQKYALPEIERKVSRITSKQLGKSFQQPLFLLHTSFEHNIYSNLATPFSIHPIYFSASNRSDLDFIETEVRIAFSSPNGRELGEFCLDSPLQKPLRQRNFKEESSYSGSVQRCSYVPPKQNQPKSAKDELSDDERLIALGSSKTLRIVPYLVSGTTANGERVTCSRNTCQIVQ